MFDNNSNEICLNQMLKAYGLEKINKKIIKKKKMIYRKGSATYGDCKSFL